MGSRRSMSIKKIFIIYLFLLAFVANVQYSHAEEYATDKALNKLDSIGRITGFGETKSGDLGLYDKIAMIINILLGFAGIIATILIIIAGTKWIMAGGNEEEVTKAKTTIKNSVIGIGIVLASYIVVNYVVGELITIFTT